MPKNLKDLETTLKALANKRRLAIVQFIRAKSEAAVGAIAEAIHLSFKATSRHLFVLTRANILEKEQRGSYMFYTIASDIPESARKVIGQL